MRSRPRSRAALMGINTFSAASAKRGSAWLTPCSSPGESVVGIAGPSEGCAGIATEGSAGTGIRTIYARTVRGSKRPEPLVEYAVDDIFDARLAFGAITLAFCAFVVDNENFNTLTRLDSIGCRWSHWRSRMYFLSSSFRCWRNRKLLRKPLYSLAHAGCVGCCGNILLAVCQGVFRRC